MSGAVRCAFNAVALRSRALSMRIRTWRWLQYVPVRTQAVARARKPRPSQHGEAPPPHPPCSCASSPPEMAARARCCSPRPAACVAGRRLPACRCSRHEPRGSGCGSEGWRSVAHRKGGHDRPTSPSAQPSDADPLRPTCTAAAATSRRVVRARSAARGAIGYGSGGIIDFTLNEQGDAAARPYRGAVRPGRGRPRQGQEGALVGGLVEGLARRARGFFSPEAGIMLVSVMGAPNVSVGPRQGSRYRAPTTASMQRPLP